MDSPPCTRCGRPIDQVSRLSGYNRCVHCADADYCQRMGYKRAGLCRCGRLAAKGKTKCRFCRKSAQKYDQQRYTTNRDTLKRVAAQRAQDGLCRCGNERKPGRKKCERCLRVDRKAAKQYYRNKVKGRQEVTDDG